MNDAAVRPPAPLVCSEASGPPIVSVTPESMSNVPVLAEVAPVKEVVNLFAKFVAVVSAVTWNVPPLKRTCPLRPANAGALPDAMYAAGDGRRCRV